MMVGTRSLPKSHLGTSRKSLISCNSPLLHGISNSIRLRENLVCKFLDQFKPEVLCLQEIKSPTDLVGTENYKALGYNDILVRGQKSYYGVAIISKIPMVEVARRNFINRDEARHLSARLENGMAIENFHVPAGGDIPDHEENPNLRYKLDLIREMNEWLAIKSPRKTILAGDLNIEPLKHDVRFHKQLLKVVSPTPVEFDGLNSLMQSGGWIDTVRFNISEGKPYSRWSYRARDSNASDRGHGLDHFWASSDFWSNVGNSVMLRETRRRDRPSDHVPVMTRFRV